MKPFTAMKRCRSPSPDENSGKRFKASPLIEKQEIPWKLIPIDIPNTKEKRCRSHPSLPARMSAILLDWLQWVCDSYELHRETYYKATIYIDRYLTVSHNIPIHQLKLIGITCLFLAAKIESRYSPDLASFAWITNGMLYDNETLDIEKVITFGACTDNEIRDKELVILKCLNWNLNTGSQLDLDTC